MCYICLKSHTTDFVTDAFRRWREELWRQPRSHTTDGERQVDTHTNNGKVVWPRPVTHLCRSLGLCPPGMFAASTSRYQILRLRQNTVVNKLQIRCSK